MPEAAPKRWLIEQFVDRFAQAMESMTGRRAVVDWEAGTKLEEGVAHLIWEQPLQIGTGETAWVIAPEDAWSEVGLEVLKATGIEDSDAETIRSTFLEIVGQGFSALCQTLSPRVRREVACLPGREIQARPANAGWFTVKITLSSLIVVLSVGFSPGLAAALESPPQDDPASVGDSRQLESECGRSRVIGNSKTLDLLLDVELSVSVSFGRAQLPLKDVIKLTTGSIVELNRSVTEPVEVIVNNCVIARGEVVVVEGNFGVRIQQVVSRQERLRSLD